MNKLVKYFKMGENNLSIENGKLQILVVKKARADYKQRGTK